jgi:eukaryotic-like serine/threonine-protein kinase
MALPAGSRLGPYEILTPLGAGGMGEVYKARDTRLDRTVAIKVLPDHVAADTEARTRLEREAKAISQLNHPHICTLYDLGRDALTDSAQPVDYLVLEYLEGETLARRLDTGPLNVAEALKLAMQIAGALDKAHRHGIIHRDLKPANVMVTRNGAKLLDFGLAKAATAGQDLLITRTTPLTAQGTILGTYQYMSPEQIEGAEVDARSDIWAFGCVLYEMLTGRPAFIGKTHASLIGAILRDQPAPVSTVQPLTPPALDRLVQSCLAKDPQERFDTAHDLLLQLRWIAEGGSAAGVAAPVIVHRKRREIFAWSVAALAAIALLGAVGFIASRPAANPPRAVALTIAPPKGTSFRGWALSPDGTTLAFTANPPGQPTQLWIRRLDEHEARTLPGTDGASYPFWSPDSKQVAFFAGGFLRKIDVAGGPPTTLAGALGNRGGAWSPTGEILFGTAVTGFSKVPATGGNPVAVTKTAERSTAHRWPQFLPDGRHFLFFVATAGPGQGLAVASLDDPTPRLLMAGTSNGVYVESGHLLFVQKDTLFGQSFDPATARLSGTPFVVSRGVGESPGGFKSMLDCAAGVLAYSASPLREFVLPTWFDRSGTNLGPALPAEQYLAPVVSPDGKQLAAHRVDQATGNWDIWVSRIDTKIARRLTTHAADDQAPIWSRDGRQIVFASLRDTLQRDLYLISATAPDTETLLLRTPNYKTATDWSPDGKHVLYTEVINGQSDLLAFPIEGDRKPIVVTATKFAERSGHFSPDGKWITYDSNATGRDEIYVTSFPPSRDVVQVSSAGGTWPIWSADGREIYYLSGSDEVMAVPVRFENGVPAPGVPTRVFQARIGGARVVRNYYDYSPQTRRFLIVAPAENQTADDTPTKIVVNWRPAPGR